MLECSPWLVVSPCPPTATPPALTRPPPPLSGHPELHPQLHQRGHLGQGPAAAAPRDAAGGGPVSNVGGWRGCAGELRPPGKGGVWGRSRLRCTCISTPPPTPPPFCLPCPAYAGHVQCDGLVCGQDGHHLARGDCADHPVLRGDVSRARGWLLLQRQHAYIWGCLLCTVGK